MLTPKIEGLPDDHPSKPRCLLQLALLFESIGDHEERKALLTRTIQLERERRDVESVAPSLRELANANRQLDLLDEGIQQAKEALEIYERLGKTVEQASRLISLARLSLEDKQLDAAIEVMSRGLGLLSEESQEFLVCRSHRVLGKIYQSKGERVKAIHHPEVAIEIATPLDWHHHLFRIHFSLASLLSDEGGYDNAHNHVELAKPHAINNVYPLGRAMLLQVKIWYRQLKLEEATCEALLALGVFEKLGGTKYIRACQDLLRDVKQSQESGSSGELPEAILCYTLSQPALACSTTSSTLTNTA